jgi:hypothetical protein
MTSEQKNENKRSSGIKAMNLLTQIASELNSYSQEPNYQYAIEFLDNRELGLAFEYFG